jgi:hypothetical protein
LGINDWELFLGVRAKQHQPKRVRHFKSGMVGIARGQIGRLNVVNTAAPGSFAELVVLMALTANPHSERLVHSTFALKPGMSVFLDVDGDAIAAGEERRHEVRAEVTALDDRDCACVVTLEVFDKETGKTTALIEVAEAQAVEHEAR